MGKYYCFYYSNDEIPIKKYFINFDGNSITTSKNAFKTLGTDICNAVLIKNFLNEIDKNNKWFISCD